LAKEKGSIKTGGRKKGTPNQKTRDARDLMERLGVDPLEFLFLTIKEDWKALGYESRYETKVLKDGGTIEVPVIEFSSRLTAAKEAAKYVYPQTKALEMTSGDGEGFVIKIEDYGSKK
jgi:hypothetical protein